MKAVSGNALLILLCAGAGCGEAGAGAGSSGAATSGAGGAGGAACLPAKQPLGVDPMKGESFPDVSLKRCAGDKVAFNAIRCGAKITLLSVGAGWCQPCIQETPTLESLSVKLKPEGIGIVQVLFQDTMAQPATTLFCSQWVSQFSLTMPVFIDPVGETLTPFGSAAVPVNVVVDHDGKVLWALTGAIPMNLEETLRGLLPK